MLGFYTLSFPFGVEKHVPKVGGRPNVLAGVADTLICKGYREGEAIPLHRTGTTDSLDLSKCDRLGRNNCVSEGLRSRYPFI